ncbi:MAG: hybrid sensor histidine kinase/response regulator [Aphanothece sp. CMT-3BRIN-NPC111]|jgi:type IV pili sensor histidine kinase/response regulator|nr:hybrid sensor histidine kinase/response regulator [Aphanothece sp. CMT-3BRIN-NPC111]
MGLTAANLDAILQEARACFLYEDAPDYLAMFEQGMQQLLSGNTAINVQAEYTTLMRATHSLKGGAGLAELHILSKLAHKLEDLLQALHEGRVPQLEDAYELLSLGLEQTRDLIAEASSSQNSKANLGDSSLPIITVIESFLQDLPQVTPDEKQNYLGNLPPIPVNASILKTALEIDLEDCLQRVEQLVSGQGKSTSSAILQQALTNLVEECLLLGEMLSLAWLSEIAERVRQVLNQPKPPLKKLAIKAIAHIRKRRSETLNPVAVAQRSSGAKEQRSKIAEEEKNYSTSNSSLKIQTAQLRPQASNGSTGTERNALSLNLRIPVSRLDRMSNTVGELLINHERLSLYQVQLFQANITLRKRTQQMNPIRQQVQEFYDRTATSHLAASSGQSVLGGINSSFNKDEFDALEFDQYTEIHSTLQDFQELMVRVEESRADIELIARDLNEGLDQLRQQLDSLRGDLTESRLVPFKFLADRFVAPLQTLNQRYKKSAALEVVGKDTLIDQVILEQLQTPLTHLLRNAFDHGIETPEERLILDKSTKAKITLSASVQGNQVKITLSDDGRGIDCNKVYQKAVQSGLCSLDAAELTREEIIEFLFTPGFSTAATVTDISGRGVGLDVVRSQVGRLHGKVLVKTELGQGTTFSITVPLTLSILPLLLCRCQQQTLAIPSLNVLEIIALSEFCEVGVSQPNAIVWRDRQIPLFSLIKLLPYAQAEIFRPSATYNPYLGIVLDVEGEQIVVAVDSLVGERELVLKPFDKTIPVPAYVAGCTVLGTGEVVPILSPFHFGELIARTKQAKPAITQSSTPDISRRESDYNNAYSILIVDDSIAVRRLLNRILSQSGYQVMECRDGKEALEELNQSQGGFDLVISDIEMPRLDGFALLREIRTHPRWHSLKIMMLTSRENDRHRKKAMSLGATAYLTKPFHPAELLKAISTLLSKTT